MGYKHVLLDSYFGLSSSFSFQLWDINSGSSQQIDLALKRFSFQLWDINGNIIVFLDRLKKVLAFNYGI